MMVTDGCQDGGGEEDCLDETEWNFHLINKVVLIHFAWM